MAFSIFMYDRNFLLKSQVEGPCAELWAAGLIKTAGKRTELTQLGTKSESLKLQATSLGDTRSFSKKISVISSNDIRTCPVSVFSVFNCKHHFNVLARKKITKHSSSGPRRQETCATSKANGE